VTDPRVWARYRSYLSTPPEFVVEWQDPPTGARGWLVMNSLRGGAAGGGTRMRVGVTRDEVTYLAKAMELKFAFCGPPIGGGKSGIAFDAADPRRGQVLRRWFHAVRPLLAECYGTGGDVNVDEQRDVVPICRELGLAHPQQGVVVGHLRVRGDELRPVFENLGAGLALPLGDPALAAARQRLTVSDMVTGFGVARAAARTIDAGPGGLQDVRVIVEGFGNVGAAAALYLARAGARLVAIVDADGYLVDTEGLDLAAVTDLLIRRSGRTLPDHPLRCQDLDRNRPYDVPADLLVPAAISDSLDRRRLEQIAAGGVRWIVCGANHPFRESFLGDTTTAEWADRHFTIVPDVVGSMGMARAFAHLMTGGAARRPSDVFDAVAAVMDETLSEVVTRAGAAGPGLLAAALDLALDRTGFDGGSAVRPDDRADVA
jgi:glutamate dehydrogenase/leucine dehydrogenase